MNDEMKNDGVSLIAAERQRQIEVEGWTPEHDDEHTASELSRAASSYTRVAAAQANLGLHCAPRSGSEKDWDFPSEWDAEWWKPSPDPIRNLVKAGALIAAEIDRLQREANREGASK